MVLFLLYVAQVLLSRGPSASDIYIFCENPDKNAKPLGFELSHPKSETEGTNGPTKWTSVQQIFFFLIKEIWQIFLILYK